MAVLSRSLERSQRLAMASPRIWHVLLVTAAAIGVIGLLQVVQTSDATTTNFAIQRLEQKKLEAQTEVHQLEAQVAFLSSLARIEREASERLGLEPPVAQQAVEVNVAWPASDQPQLPTRFLPVGEAGAEGDADESPWWRDLLGLLSFD